MCAGPDGSVIYGAAESGAGVSLVRAPPTPDDPRGDSILYRVFPRFEMKTFTFAISMVQLAMFFITLIVGGVKCDGAFVKGNNMCDALVSSFSFSSCASPLTFPVDLALQNH